MGPALSPACAAERELEPDESGAMSGRVAMRAVSEQEAGLRLDRWFQRHFPELSHGALQKLLRTGQVRIDGRRAEGKDRVEPGQTIRLPPGVTASPPPKPREIPTVSDHDAAEIRRLVIHRDDHVIVLNKPPGLAVQGGTGTERHVDGMLDALRFGFEERPRLVHRLDKDTSGVLLIARTGQAAKRLGSSFRDRETEKLYWAVVVGVPTKARGAIDLPLAKRPGARDRELMQVDREEGQKALTHFQVLDRAGKRAALLALWPRTGRTHQLRVHCAAIGCPILGDGKYGGEEALLAPVADARRLHLHARRLTLPHPSGKGELKVEAEAPPHFRRTVEAFGFSFGGD
jgi:23S rRNA pseudouridine955/2504/2580 synthase